jgi:hypothetical protein
VSGAADRGTLEDLLETLPMINDGDVMALTAFRAGEDAGVLAAARARAEAAVASGGGSDALAKARVKVERWAEKTGGGEVAAFLGGTDGMRRVALRLQAAPTVLDAALAFAAGTGISDDDAATLTAAWSELELGDQDDADLDALAEAAGADPDDPSGARI